MTDQNAEYVPARIIVEPHEVGWKMTIESTSGRVLDSTLSSARWLVWRMAKQSWRRGQLMTKKPCSWCGHLKGQHRSRLADVGMDGRQTDINTSCKICECGEYNQAAQIDSSGGGS